MPVTEAFSRVETFAATVPAMTPAATPEAAALSFNPGEVVGLGIVIPDGHHGLTGIAIAYGNVPVIPFAADSWIVGNDEPIEWPLHGLPDTGSFSAIMFNLDRFAHTFYLRFLINEIGVGGAGQPVALPALQLS